MLCQMIVNAPRNAGSEAGFVLAGDRSVQVRSDQVRSDQVRELRGVRLGANRPETDGRAVDTD